MLFPIHARTSDEIGHLAAVTLASGIEDADNPLDNLTGFDPSATFLTSSSDTDVDIVWDHLMAVLIKVFSLHMYNLPAGTEIRLQRNATNTWGAPTIDIPITIGVYPQIGLPFPIGIDLTLDEAYDEDTPLRYTRLHIPSLSQLVGLGSALLWEEKRTGWDPDLPPSSFMEQQAATTFKTALGRLRGYRKGVRLRSQPFRMRQENAGWAEFIALFRECSSVTPFLFWRDPTHGGDPWLAAFDADTIREERPVEGDSYTVSEVSGQFNEIGNGVAIPTSAEIVT